MDSMAHWWVPVRTHGTPPVPDREGRGWPETSTRRPQTDDNKTPTGNKTPASLESNVLSATSADTHLGSFMVAEPVRETGDLRRDFVKLRERMRSRLCWRVEAETSRNIRKIAQKNETQYPGEDQPRDRAHQDSPESVH